jgi:hypothetical protein
MMFICCYIRSHHEFSSPSFAPCATTINVSDADAPARQATKIASAVEEFRLLRTSTTPPEAVASFAFIPITEKAARRAATTRRSLLPAAFGAPEPRRQRPPILNGTRLRRFVESSRAAGLPKQRGAAVTIRARRVSMRSAHNAAA